jgi:hypothetical protein
MKRTSALVIVLGLVAGTSARAQVPHDVCVGRGFGVPTRPGPPAWAAWTNSSPDVNTDLDDPRWNRAAAKSFVTGSATAPMHVRALWSPDSTGQEYLYLSLVSDLNPNSSTPRDVFVGFRRANSSPSVDSGSVGYIFEFHLGNGAALAPATVPAFCGGYDRPECQLDHDWWRLFRDPDLAPDPLKKCIPSGGGEIVGHQYIQMNGAGGYLDRPFTWQASPTDADFVHYWKLDTSRWAIQLRIKIVPTSAASPPPISAGIEKTATFWYEITESVTTQYASLGKFPEPVGASKTGVTKSICVSPQHNNDSLFHEELGSHDPACPGPSCVCPGCNPNTFSKLTEIAGAPGGGDCDTGLAIFTHDIGAVFNNPGPYDSLTPTNAILIDASSHANTMIAQVENNVGGPPGGADISAPITARFRLANWGSGPIGSDQGQFDDVPGGSAVCLGGASCAAQTIPYGTKKAIHFDWTLGKDSTRGLSELCSYGLTPPGGGCLAGNGSNGCAVGTTKSTTNPDPTTGGAPPCLTLHNPHECMFVELTSPNGDATFVQASAFNNMNFGAMSVLAREALIDARKLPKAPGQKVQDIYFFVVPRNMPASVPAGTTVTGLIHDAAIARAVTVAAPYIADIARLTREDPERLRQIEIDLSRQRRQGQSVPVRVAAAAVVDDKRIAQVRRAMLVMPNDDFERVGKLVALAADPGEGNQPNDALVHEAVSSLGPSEAAQLVPTLEVYPFFKPANQVVYQPMTSFALFLSHEATLGGIAYQVDGATKIAENVYHVAIPVDFARKIQIRAQALVGAEAALPPGNPKWPCAGGCACGGGGTRSCGLVTMIGNTAPGLIAGVFAVRRRRKKTAK